MPGAAAGPTSALHPGRRAASRSPPDARTTATDADDVRAGRRDALRHRGPRPTTVSGARPEVAQQVGVGGGQPFGIGGDHEEGGRVAAAAVAATTARSGAVGGDEPGGSARGRGSPPGERARAMRGAGSPRAVDPLDAGGVAGRPPWRRPSRARSCRPRARWALGVQPVELGERSPGGYPSGRVSSTGPPCTAAAGTAAHPFEGDSAGDEVDDRRVGLPGERGLRRLDRGPRRGRHRPGAPGAAGPGARRRLRAGWGRPTGSPTTCPHSWARASVAAAADGVGAPEGVSGPATTAPTPATASTASAPGEVSGRRRSHERRP